MSTKAAPRKKRAKVYRHCRTCKAEKVAPQTKLMPRWVYEQDPYCSRACAEQGEAS